MNALTPFLLLLSVLWLMVTVCGGAPMATKVKTLVVFGDEFSDDGVVAYPGTDRHGFQRQSNGPIWAEYAKESLRWKVDNYAYSFAESGFDNRNFEGWSGALSQIERYLCRLNGSQIPEDVLVVIAVGSNNVFHPLHGTGDIGLQTELPQNWNKSLNTLLTAGANKIIIFNLPPVEKFPAVGKKKEAANVVRSLNAKLRQMVRAYQGRGVTMLDLHSVVSKELTTFKIIDRSFDSRRNNLKPQDIFDYAWVSSDGFNPSTVLHAGVAKKFVAFLKEK